MASVATLEFKFKREVQQGNSNHSVTPVHRQGNQVEDPPVCVPVVAKREFHVSVPSS